MEQQAKERLTGGVILVVLLVLLVPELLTGPRPVLPPVAVQPDQAPMRSYTMDLGEAPRASRGPVAASTTAPPTAPPATDSVAASSAPAQDTLTPAAVSAPALSPNGKPIAQPIAQPTAPAPRVAAPSPARVPAPAHGAGTWSVQLGTFSNRDNAARLVSRLKSHGFSAAISEATKSGHKLFRVRIGAERDRAAAQRLQGRLQAVGEKGGEIVPR